MTNKEELVCIVCPNSCLLTINNADGKLPFSVDGALCKKGNEYAITELTNPVRTLTTTVKVLCGTSALVSVRTDKHISKAKIVECVNLLHQISIQAPVAFQQVVVENILGTEANVIATSHVELEE